MVQEMISASGQDKPHYSHMHVSCRYAIIGGMSEGQLIYSINRTKLTIETETFVKFLRYKNENGNNCSDAIVKSGGSNRFKPYFIRDVMLSVGGDYPTECIYLCKNEADLNLRRLKRKAAKALLDEVDNT